MDPALERSRLAGALVSGTGELDDRSDAATLLQSFADLLVRATPHFRLAWFYIGHPHAETITPQYCAGAEAAYGRQLVIDRSTLMMRGPVRRACEAGESVVQTIPLNLGPVGWIVSGVRRWHRAALGARVRDVLALPFPLVEGEDWGLTVVYADTPEYFDRVGLDSFNALARLVQVGLDRISLRSAEQRTRSDLEEARVRDPLTELPNQVGFEEQWSARPRLGRHRPMLLHLDLDDFAALNAGLGPQGGDAVLRAVATRLGELVGDGGLVGRVGPDEFLLGTRLDPGRDPDAFAEHCQAVVGHSLTVAGRTLALSAAIGHAVGDDTAPPTPQQAALALRQARGDGRGSIRAFARGDDHAMGDTPQGLFGELRDAMAAGELTLWYQPQVALDGPTTVVGAEALLRWRRADGAMVPPNAFIPAVEGSAMIRDIGLQVLGEAAAAVERGPVAALPSLGVNIGVRHLLHPRFLEDMDGVLSRWPGAARRLSVEITETAAFSDMAATHRVIHDLRRRGLTVSLDDFGTGHASFSQLVDLPVDQIKIDRQFVDGLDQHPRRMALVESMLVAARGLGLGVVAEGVETQSEAATLLALGCNIAQGFLYARPMPAADLTGWLAERQTAGAKNGSPSNRPSLAVLTRLRAVLQAAENGHEDAELPVAVPDWFRRSASAEALAPVDDYLARWSADGTHPAPGDAGRARALAAVAELVDAERYRGSAMTPDRRPESFSAEQGRP